MQSAVLNYDFRFTIASIDLSKLHQIPFSEVTVAYEPQV